jgi:hypothetical protein
MIYISNTLRNDGKIGGDDENGPNDSLAVVGAIGTFRSWTQTCYTAATGDYKFVSNSD